MGLTKTCLYLSSVGIELAESSKSHQNAKKIEECDWLGIAHD